MDQSLKKEENLPFEEAMNKLEDLVSKLEEGDVPLEQAISMFQEGMTLSKNCHDKLTKVEAQLDQIMNDDGEIIEVDLQKEAAE
ncbi:exodeoxyribonuclease VII small subunit [Bacillus sp. JCM 19046]|uniref:Exodeoxyribonuclease 7 small subunit n=1 Tax=Shouchella xiaoxiensis TaxID=766895 RepID=A0ABS2SXR6_9BACI|nr:exodeoxyribonuclease VII small subunit [Shouchella xiaoxiensis]MBM7840298.1 exodeoxyribonuclease VII small subunit [Shouchella xiaoxiensis]GAF13675.1 exodeoxyribonuclease VII small subunit [Bacillus sp. JCM 19045]GAF16575.1 exodeoxyribonuclease VII small subunit [Bacillus sp. JCM 19046]